MNPIKIGVLSTANIAVRSVIPAIDKLDQSFELYGIASRSHSKAEEVAQKFDIQAFGSYDELLETPSLDAVYIPLPNSMHIEWVKKALSLGIHVLVEKSLGCNFTEVEELTTLAKSNRCVLMENFQFRFHAQLAALKEILFTSKKIGEVRSFKAFFGFPPFPDEKNIRYKAELGGGALLDAGAYTIKVSQLILGQNLNVAAAVLHNDTGKGVDLWGSGMLTKIDSAISSQISFGFDNFYQNGVEVWGSKGKLFTNRLFTARADFEPTFLLQTNNGDEIITLTKDDHFKNMLLYFHSLVTEFDPEKVEQEHQQNLNQARLIQSFKDLAYGK